ncbi:hypothetical protein AB0I98_23160 [Streptomyces sp. NPDC050211]|uniref:hypothetical protein n=1 Tax=Streptomyces sp. NPDC050211 TaxID=3154932 RepID=UPI003443359F
MTTKTLPRLPRLSRRTRTHNSRVAPWTPPGGWARPTPVVLLALEAALALWSA